MSIAAPLFGAATSEMAACMSKFDERRQT